MCHSTNPNRYEVMVTIFVLIRLLEEGPQPGDLIQKKLPSSLHFFSVKWWLVSTHLKNMLVKMRSSCPSLGVKIKYIYETAT